jgi:hypothetical protein
MTAIGTGGIYQATLAALEGLQSEVAGIRPDIDALLADIAAAEAILASYGTEFAYTKAEVDAFLALKANLALLSGYVQTSTLVAGYVANTRNIAVAGLATGGGTLAADRTITVAKATNEQADAGTLDTVAITPLTGKRMAERFGSAFKGLQFFDSSGSYVPTSGCKAAIIIATGGGSGDDGVSGCGAGATSIALFANPTTQAVTIGAGGVDGGVPTNGGATSVGTVCVAAGGVGATGAGGDAAAGTGLMRINGGTAYGLFGMSFWGGRGAYGSRDRDGINGAPGCVLILEF